MSVLERFLRYVSYDTQSDDESQSVPTSEKQLVLGALLAEELRQIGLEDAHVDDKGYVYGWLPATAGLEHLPCVGFIAHLDTTPDSPGAYVKPKVVAYQGGDIVLNEALGIVTHIKEFPLLADYVGQDMVVTDGTTLLGADDKAGVAEIVSAMEYLVAHPELPHGRIGVAFTPDEEVGRGADYFDVAKFGVLVAYTVDGGELGEVEYENFNAAEAKVLIHGRNIHPGGAKDKMKNAILMGIELAQMLPPAQTPGHTEGYEGFYHLRDIRGDETLTTLTYIIRDHDFDIFEGRKAFLEQVAQFLNQKYGDGTVVVEMRDQYYNMKEQLTPHMYLITNAQEAMKKAGVTPCTIPIRGGTDGARLSYMGLPCPNLSTGGMNFHGVNECIPVPAMEKMVEVLVHLATAPMG